MDFTAGMRGSVNQGNGVPRAQQENPAVLPGGGNAVFAAPAKIGGSIFGMGIELENLKRMSG